MLKLLSCAEMKARVFWNLLHSKSRISLFAVVGRAAQHTTLSVPVRRARDNFVLCATPLENAQHVTEVLRILPSQRSAAHLRHLAEAAR